MFAKRLEIAGRLAIQRLRLKVDGWKASRARKKALKERVRTSVGVLKPGTNGEALTPRRR
jgi:hypothetical protein